MLNRKVSNENEGTRKGKREEGREKKEEGEREREKRGQRHNGKSEVTRNSNPVEYKRSSHQIKIDKEMGQNMVWI
jgi:hypothetical protein